MSNVCICVSMCVLFHYSPAFESSMYDAKKDVVSHVNTRVSLSNQNNNVEATWSLSKKGFQVDGFLVWNFFEIVYYEIHLNASQNSMSSSSSRLTSPYKESQTVSYDIHIHTQNLLFR